MDDPEVSAALTAMLHEPLPVSSVDLTLARETGRVIRRRRRTATALGSTAAAVIAVVAIAGSLVLTNGIAKPAQGEAAGPSSTSAGPSGTSTASATNAALTGTDPIRTTARFGWLPAGAAISDQNWGTGGDEQMALIGTKPLGAGIDLSVSYGAEPPLGNLPGGKAATRIPAADVNGDHAYWLAKPRAGGATGDQDVTLRWKFASNGWANLEIFGLTSDQDFTTLVYQIADSVTFGHSDPVALPFHIAALPAGLTIDAGHHATEPQMFGGEPGELPVYTWAAGVSGGGGQTAIWSINTQPYVPGPTKAPDTGGFDIENLTVDGHHAELDPMGLTVFDVDGMTVNVRATGKYLTDINAAGGYTALFNRLTLLGDNQANWTTHVLG